MSDLVKHARSYVANNAAESGADALIVELADRIEALEDAARAQMAAILGTIGGTVEGHPTSAINYLQRLRQLVEIEASTALDKIASE